MTTKTLEKAQVRTTTTAVPPQTTSSSKQVSPLSFLLVGGALLGLSAWLAQDSPELPTEPVNDIPRGRGRTWVQPDSSTTGYFEGTIDPRSKWGESYLKSLARLNDAGITYKLQQQLAFVSHEYNNNTSRFFRIRTVDEKTGLKKIIGLWIGLVPKEMIKDTNKFYVCIDNYPAEKTSVTFSSESGLWAAIVTHLRSINHPGIDHGLANALAVDIFDIMKWPSYQEGLTDADYNT